jgi:hypothetical protein
MGLCNFFSTQIKDFAIIAAPLFQVTRKDSGYKNSPLPPDVWLHAFKVLQKQLTLDLIMALSQSDRKYALITDSATGTADFPGGLGAIYETMSTHMCSITLRHASDANNVKQPETTISL